MTARQIIAAICNNVDSLDDEVFVRVLVRDGEYYVVTAEKVAPVARIGIKGCICIEHGQLKEQP